MNFLIAGRDTTAQSLSWLFYELFQHPEDVEEMVREINEVCKGGLLQYEDMKKLPYTQACIAEAIRLHPAVPRNAKQCVKDSILRPEGPNAAGLPDIFVRKGEWAGWSDWVMARRTDVW
jgi:cytochrome P450